MADHSVLAGAISFPGTSSRASLTPIHSRRTPPDDLHERQAQQFNNKNGEDDAQGDRHAGAEHDAQRPLPLGQRTAGKRNEHGIVAREKNIDFR